LGVVCITRYTQQAVSDLAKRTWVVPNAVDSAFFDIEVRPPPDIPPRVLCVGTVSLRKNQNPFIRALDALAARRPFELVFAGLSRPGRAYDDEFLALIKDRPWCRMAGLANREELKAMLREASLLALPSLEDNCPMVVLEAMAAGVPVMAANVAGLPDLIEEGKTGFFCDLLDAASMRTAIDRALADSAAREAVAREAKRKARERFHPLVIARRHLEIYREVLASVS
jgi:glycosyltransferase involved in cell wall biosynthesis